VFVDAYHRSVKFSVTLGAAGQGRDPAALASLAGLAEAAGWDAFFLEDYLSYRGLPTYDPWVCLAAIAAATARIRLGTTVTPLPRRHPWELAAQAVAVDHLSAGRLVLGVGSGAADDLVSTAVGTPMTAPERAARLDEGLQILTALWTGTAVHHHGRRYRIDGLKLPATPVQQPRIPIWVGGDLRRPGVRRRLTQWDGACVYRERALDPADVSDIAALIRAAGRDLAGYDIKVSGNQDRLADLAAAGATWWGRWIPPGNPDEARKIIAAGPPGRPGL
jgi:alkanesulfonate monooxygenase SsuD/methylene tetrahydromethanopterin reductase-like flavin-dependent oxidoreductase (luciferase family)